MKRFLSMILAFTFILSLCIVPSAATCEKVSVPSEAITLELDEAEISPRDQTYQVTRYANAVDGKIVVGLKMYLTVREDTSFVSGYRIIAVESTAYAISSTGVEKVDPDVTITSYSISADRQSANFIASIKVQFLNSASYNTVPMSGTVRV